jgi:hypothetical protein
MGLLPKIHLNYATQYFHEQSTFVSAHEAAESIADCFQTEKKISTALN